MTRTRWLIAYATLLLILLWPKLSHAAVDYKFVSPIARGGSAGATGADSTHCWTIGKANASCIPGRTFVLMPGSYLGDGSTDISSCVAPQAAGSGLSPDSSVRYISSDVYFLGKTSAPGNFTVRGTELDYAFVMVAGLKTFREASCNRQTGLIGAQFDSLTFCVLAGLGVYGVNTLICYRDTVYLPEIGATLPSTLPSYLVGIMGENSSCLRNCTLESQDVLVRRCVVYSDSMRQGAKIFMLLGRDTRGLIDSCKITGLLVSKPALGNVGNLAAGIWAQTSDGVTFRDNNWTLDMKNGANCSGCNTNENITGLAFFYIRDSTNHFQMLRDTATICKGASAPGTGVQAHWSASGSGTGANNHNAWEQCVFRGEFFRSNGWDFQYQFDHYSLNHNAFFSDSGGSPLNFASTWLSGNTIKRNTVVSRESPAVILSGNATAIPDERNELSGNAFIRMRTTRGSLNPTASGAVAFLQTPLGFPQAFQIDQNVYYSYTGAVSQSVGWGSSTGSCVGKGSPRSCLDSCGTMADNSPSCWPPTTNYTFDAFSRFGDPLFTDTTATAFSGNIKCFHLTTGAMSSLIGLLPSDSAIGSRQPQGRNTNPREPYAYATDSLNIHLVIDTLSTDASSITFKFKAPPDDENTLVGTAGSYEVAVSDQPIDISTFGVSTHVTPPAPAAPGTIVSFTIPAVTNRVYYTAVRTIGSCGRISSAISVNGCAQVRGSLVLCP